MTKLLGSILLVLFCLNSIRLLSQEEPARPKIGLVLSGGGAKGLAHIGAIKVLEEAGIRPDYITGTSMGSIIGGLYAAGYSATEMDSIVRTIDWAVVLSDQIPLSDVVPEEKADYNRFQLEFDITPKGIKLPAGMVQGQQISRMLSDLTWHVSDCATFDDLPIPFRCVAVDLVTGESYVYKDGDLVQAMRASMAIPSVFTPVEKDSMYLVDGGVLDNFPTRLCREMGADIIIGVNVGSSEKPDIEDLKSITEILMTSAMIGSSTVLDESIDATDYLITPELHPYTSASFTDGEGIIERGEEAARLQEEAFRHLADSLGIQKRTPKTNNYTANTLVVSKIIINNRQHVSRNYFLSKLGINEGDTISKERINTGISRLIGTRFYNLVTYDIEPDESNYIITFNTEETKLARTKFSIHYDNELKAGLIANITLRNLIFKNSRLSITTDISENPRAHGEMISYLGEKQNTGFIADGYFEYTPLPIYQNNLKKAGTLNYSQIMAGGGIFLSYKTRSMIAAKVSWEEIRVTQASGLSNVFDQGVELFGNGFVYGTLIADRNTLNKRFYATKGHHIHLKAKLNYKAYEFYEGESDAKALIEPFIDVPEQYYLAGSLHYQKNFSASKNTHIEVGASLAAFSADAPFFDMHHIGGTAYNISTGDAAFIGLNYREKIAENYALGSFKINFNITPTIYAHAAANGIYSPNYGNKTFEGQNFYLGANEYIIGFGGGLSINSLIGPITVGLGTNLDDWKVRAYVNVGFPFM
ncbi:patatin-like phospholipase family protein [Carboxylicivirga sp. M1479]|uniref:patatin-like phospholipase family protein n=1 Tax=Carboxylicivirga sp. M1479 TaxID=2594476 RepID=UPI0011775C86|nr:patatin-like phospholipase family protein [Carboxylicivirga sp. M1479]TRX72149.1 patatin [Carboxylicivirga sp. M1479]